MPVRYQSHDKRQDQHATTAPQLLHRVGQKKTRDSVHLCYMRPDFCQGPSTRGLISPRGVALDATWGWLSLCLSLFFLFCLLPAAADRPDLTHGKSMHTPNMDAHRAHPDVKNYADLFYLRASVEIHSMSALEREPVQHSLFHLRHRFRLETCATSTASDFTGIGCLGYRHQFRWEIRVTGTASDFTGIGCLSYRHRFGLEMCVTGTAGQFTGIGWLSYRCRFDLEI